jgi:xylan 1,4-beta-xylosidase
MVMLRGWLGRRFPVMVRLAVVFLSTGVVVAALRADPVPAARDRVLVEVRADQVLGRGSVAGAANLGYEEAYAVTMAPVADMGYRWQRAVPCLHYVRCSQWLADGVRGPEARAFSGCRVYREGAGGTPEYNWEALDHVLDVLVAAGLRPVMVLGGMPDALAAPGSARGAGGGIAGRPKDFRRYQALVEALLRHLEKAYGKEEVRSWYFEVWDQPDRADYWEGGGLPPEDAAYPKERLEPFLRLYDHFAAGIAAADPQLRFGGPGIAGDTRFLRSFLEHCARGENLASGGKGARLDFISLHAPDPGAARAEVRQLVAKEFAPLKQAPVFVSVPVAGSASPSEAAEAFGPRSAARLAAQARAVLEETHEGDLCFQEARLVSDHFAPGPSFISRLGRYTVPLPIFRTAMLLTRSGKDRLACQAPAGIGGFATRSAPEAAQVLLYRAGEGAKPDEGTLPVRLRIAALPKSLVRVPLRVYAIDPHSYNPYGDWVAAGKPQPASDALASRWVGSEVYPPTRSEANFEVTDGAAVIDLDLPSDAVVMVTIGTEPTPKAIEAKTFDKTSRPRRLMEAEQAYFEAAQNQQAGEYDQAERRYLEVAKRYSEGYLGRVALATLLEMYEIEMRRPEKAEAMRERLLAMPIDEFERERLLRQRLVAAVRAGDTTRAEATRRAVAGLDERLASLVPPAR